MKKKSFLVRTTRHRTTWNRLFTGKIKCSTHRTWIYNAFATTLASGSIQLVTEKTQSELKKKKYCKKKMHSTKQWKWGEENIGERRSGQKKFDFSSFRFTISFVIFSSFWLWHYYKTGIFHLIQFLERRLLIISQISQKIGQSLRIQHWTHQLMGCSKIQTYQLSHDFSEAIRTRRTQFTLVQRIIFENHSSIVYPFEPTEQIKSSCVIYARQCPVSTCLNVCGPLGMGSNINLYG